MATIPEWARPFVEHISFANQRMLDPSRYDSAGYALPFLDASGQLSMSPSTSRPGDSYVRLLPGGSWGYDPEGNPLTGPRYNEDGSPILRDSEGNQIAEEVPYWNPTGLLGAIAQQYGAGAASPLNDLRTLYNTSELPQGGVSWDQYINTRFPGARVQNIDGLGEFLLADRENATDWSPYTSSDEEQSILGTIFKEMLPKALAMYGIGTGLGGVLNPAGMPGMAEGYGAIEASMGTPSSYVGPAAGATTAPLATLPSIAETALPAATGGATTLPATGDFSLVPQGSNAGIGGVGTAGQGLQVPGTAVTGVGAGSGSLGLNLGTGGIIADTAAQLGAGAVGTGAGLLNPGATTTPTGGSPTGNTTPTSPVTDAADNVYNPGNPSTPIPNTTTPTPKSLLQTLEEALGLPANALSGASQAATSNPFLKGLGLLGDALLSNYNTNKLGDAITQAQGMADPFGSQRGFYQNLLKESYTNPNFFKDNATLGGIRNMAVNDVSRAMAAQGYNQSTNALYGIGQRLQDEGTKYALGFQNQLGQLAGAGISPQEAARLGMQGTQLANQSRQQTATSIGDLARELPNIMKGFGLT